MKLSRIDQIALNGATGAHYKYEEVAQQIIDFVDNGISYTNEQTVNGIIKILVENFPNGES